MYLDAEFLLLKYGELAKETVLKDELLNGGP
jgi:hypothetical protein